jgi:hypothetical protein
MINECVAVGGMNIDKETEVLWETSPTNPIWTDLESNPNRHGGKPATNHLSYVVAQLYYIHMRYGSGLT